VVRRFRNRRLEDEAIDERHGVNVYPVTRERWNDLKALFGRRGADGGCWCMYYRVSASDFSRSTNERNRSALLRRINDGRVPGLIGYVDGEPAAYVGIGPRDEFARLQRSSTLYPVDDRPVWSIVCFFIHRQHREQGLAHELLRAAIGYAAEQGAEWLEGYPKDVSERAAGAAAAYPGVPGLFEKAGFEEVVRRKPSGANRPRPIMRYRITAKDRARPP
jgi:GNAT superfamily N-acetyltransferase